MRVFRLAGLLAGIGFGLTAAASAQVTNGGFETGDFTGWTQFGDTSATGVVFGNFLYDPVEGDHHAAFGPVFGVGGISQTLALTAGNSYTLSFWLANLSSGPNSFSVDFDGVTLMSLVDNEGMAYTQFSFNVTPSVNNPVLNFNFSHPPSYWLLDDVRIPEPAALSMFALAGLLIRRR